MDTKILNELKQEISYIGKRLYKKGYAQGASGNISIKQGNYILITPSGFNLGDVKVDDVVIIDMNGNLVSEGKNPSSEKALHLEIYKTRNDINSIIHAHTPKSTAFAVAGIPLNKPVLSEVLTAIGPIALVEYATPSSMNLAKKVANAFIEHDLALMANHGVVAGGKELKETYYKLETLELYAEISLWTKLLGNANELTPENVRQLIEIRNKNISS